MHLFYIENIQWIDYQSKRILLQGQEAVHASKVLRLKVNDNACATDGYGNMFFTKILEIGKNNCVLEIIDYKKEFKKRDFKIHVAIAPTKNMSRFEWFLEKATEIGIDEITPIITAHSERKTLNMIRCKSIITAAVKQSLKAYHPKLNEAIKFTDFISQNNDNQKFIAHLLNDNQRNLKQAYIPKTDVCILIGPEGDFSDSEIKLALQNNFEMVKLGEERLRTETAAMVAVNMIHFSNL